MLGSNLRIPSAKEGNKNLQEISAKLQELVQRFAQESPEFELPHFPTELTAIVQIQLGGFIYALVRYPVSFLNQLTDRQKQIASCASTGMSNKEIAEKLGIKFSTVSAHLGRIFRKLNINSRVEISRFHSILSN